MRRHTRLLHYLILAFLVAMGIEFAWGFMAAFIEESLLREQVAPALEGEPTRTERGILIRYHSQIHVQSDGTILVSEDGYHAEQAFFDLDLQPVKLSGNERWVIAAALREPLQLRERFDWSPWRERLAQIASHPPRQAWYFVHDGRRDSRGYFVGYDEPSKRLLGYIGKRGFAPEPPPRDEQFEGDGRRQWGQGNVLRGYQNGRRSYPGGIQVRTADALLPESVQFLLADGRLWKIDLTRRSSTPLTKDEGILSFDIVHMPSETGDNAAAGQTQSDSAGLIIRTPTTIKLIDLDGQQKLAWPIPDEMRGQGISWFILDDGSALAQWSERQGDRSFWWQTELARVDRDGAISRKASFELFQRAWQSPGWTAAAAVPAPVLFVSFLATMYWNPISPAVDLSDLLAENWGVLAALGAISAVLAALAYRRQTRFALAGAGAWAAFVFLLGPPGWLAYRWHRRWPVLQSCGECQRPAPRDRESCTSCGRVFAPPSLTGTEIFA